MKGKTLNTTVSKNWEGKPTPGQWRVVNSGGMVTSERDNGYFIICITETEPLRISPEVEANARLIAAAPDMLEALKELISEFSNYDIQKETGIVITKAEAAIAKATNNQ